MTAVPCPECDRSCAGPAGLASHMRSMHPSAVAPVVPIDKNKRAALTWEDPPARGGRQQVVPTLVALVPQLRSRPGEWARVMQYNGKSSANSARKVAAASPDLAGVEFRAARVGNVSRLYARWVGAGK